MSGEQRVGGTECGEMRVETWIRTPDVELGRSVNTRKSHWSFHLGMTSSYFCLQRVTLDFREQDTGALKTSLDGTAVVQERQGVGSFRSPLPNQAPPDGRIPSHIDAFRWMKGRSCLALPEMLLKISALMNPILIYGLSLREQIYFLLLRRHFWYSLPVDCLHHQLQVWTHLLEKSF